jgi:hypothetical protein
MAVTWIGIVLILLDLMEHNGGELPDDLWNELSHIADFCSAICTDCEEEEEEEENLLGAILLLTPGPSGAVVVTVVAHSAAVSSKLLAGIIISAIVAAAAVGTLDYATSDYDNIVIERGISFFDKVSNGYY